MVGLSTRYINLLVDGVPGNDSIIIDWIKKYLATSFHDKHKYLHYKGDVTHYYSVIIPSNRLFVFCGNRLIANIGLHKFKQFCRDIIKS